MSVRSSPPLEVGVHYMAAGGLCLQVCGKTSPPPTSRLRALNSCHKVSAIAQTCGGTELLPVSHLSVSVVSPVSHTLCLFTGPKMGTIEVCLVTHHISYGVWSPVEGGGGQLQPDHLAWQTRPWESPTFSTTSAHTNNCERLLWHLRDNSSTAQHTKTITTEKSGICGLLGRLHTDFWFFLSTCWWLPGRIRWHVNDTCGKSQIKI